MIYLEPNSFDPRYNTAFELYAFNEISNKDDIFILWINEPCIIVGKNQNTFEEINQKYCDDNNIKVIRRISGGGAVYQDLNNLNYTIISSDSNIKVFDFKSMSQPVIDALDEMGIKATFTGRNDILIGDQKICGNSQYVRGNKVMHHGCILFDVDLSVLSESLKVSLDKIESKGKKSVRSRVTNIKDHLKDKSFNIRDFMNILIKHMDNLYNLKEYKLSNKDQLEILKIKETHNDSWDWIYGNNPEFTIKRFKRLEYGKVEVYILVKDNIIKNIKFYGDFFGIKDVSELTDLLNDVKYTKKDIKDKLENINIEEYFLGLTIDDLVNIIID